MTRKKKLIKLKKEIDDNSTKITDFVKDENGNIVTLDLSNQLLNSIPRLIDDFKYLKSLYLHGNNISELPEEILELKYLEELFLWGNDFSSFPVIVTELKNLKKLMLSDNNITRLPEEISRLKSLIMLDLSNNELTEIPKEVSELRNLVFLDLKNNKISELPKEIIDINLDFRWSDHWELGINVAGNPLESPPVEIIVRGRKAILEYFDAIKGENLPLNEVRVLFVGDGGSGKTSLVKRLLWNRFSRHEPQTHGINIEHCELEVNNEEIKARIWDFGGQEIMHATHQFFLSKRSLYILVLDGRKDEKIEYWLKHIESFGGNSPILIAINKIDENPGHDVNRLFLINKYKGIKGFYRISCSKGTGIKELKNALKEEIFKVEILKTTWGTNWFVVKTKLENMTENYISYDHYVNICKEASIYKKSSQDTLVDFLNDLGVILRFEDLSLLDTHVLEPKWVTGAVYKIINSEILAESNGILKLSLLGDILHKKRDDDFSYPPDKHKYIIDLMKKFELCYEIDDSSVLVPDLLEIQEPKFVFDDDIAISFLIDYDFLPRSIMPRFIVRMHMNIKDKLRWRTGVVLENKSFKSNAIIHADNEEKKIYIKVCGVQKRDYLAVILFSLREINRSFEKLNAVERVPMPDRSDVTVSYSHLLKLEQLGVVTYIPEGSDKEYNVKELLGTVQAVDRSDNEILEILKSIRSKFDTKETLLRRASEAVIVQPNFFGIGVDVKKLSSIILELFGEN